MNDSARNLWAVHAEDAALFLRHNMITLGWKEMGDLSDLRAEKAAFRERFREVYPDANPVDRAGAGTLLFRLIHEVRTGDVLAFPCGSWVYLGVVAGPYACGEGLGQHRKVRWLKRLPKSDFSRDAMREIGSSPMRLFAVRKLKGEFLSAMGNLDSVANMQAERTGGFHSGAADIRPEKRGAFSIGASADVRPERADGAADFAKSVESAGSGPANGASAPPASTAPERRGDRFSDTPRFILETMRKKLDREMFQEFTAELLRAMGHQVEEPPRRGGMDFLTVRDDLLPRVLVYAKFGTVQEADIALMERSLESGQSGLILTPREFSEDVRISLRTAPGLRGVEGFQLADLVIKYYNALPVRYRNMIPLRTVCVPDI